MTVRGYQVGVDWSRSGIYTGTLEDVSSYADETDVVATWGRGDARALEDAGSGQLGFTLNNAGREFSPNNLASPIAGDVLPGTPARLQVTDPSNAAITTLFLGPMDRPEPNPNIADKDFSATCSDGWQRLGKVKLSTPVYQGQRTGDLINIVLDAAGWPADRRSIDPGATLVPYWWVDGDDAGKAVDDLMHSEGSPAIAYVAGGIFTFRDRHHRLLDAASLTSQGTYRQISPPVPNSDHRILKGSIQYDHGQANVVNSARLEVTPRIPQNRQVVWSTDDMITLGASESTTLIVRTDDPFIDLQTPQEQVIYLSDGTWTSDYHIASGSASFALSRTSGQSALLTITAGGSGVVLDLGIKIRGTPLTQGATRVFSASEVSSVNSYGDSDWGGEAPWAHFYDADMIVRGVVSGYAQPRPIVSFDVDGRIAPATLTRILGSQISDRITVRVDELGLNADFMVEKLTHTIRKLGARHILTVGAQLAEPVQASNPFTFDVAGKGFNDGQFALDMGTDPTSMFVFDAAGHGFDQGRFAA